MISHPAYTVEPWALRETELDLGVLDQAGSVFALANGHIGLRGNLDESEPQGLPGSYLNGFYEERALPYAEAGYGYPEAGQTAVNVTNGKIIRLLVDDEPFDVRSGTLRSHERVLDLRAGVLRRRVDWVSPAGQQVRVSSVRLVSLVQRAVAAVLYEVEPIGAPARLVVQSELVANEQMPAAAADPRAAPQSGGVLRSEQFSGRDARAVLVHITRKSALRIAAGMDHLVEGPPGTETATESSEDLGRLTIMADVKPGERLRMVKFVAYGWSSRRSTPALRDQVAAALAEARRAGWEGLLADQREYLDDFWERADVELEGDTELQQAVRFALFHTLQAGARSERRAIAAKGLTGPGYDGHAFWDTETFVLPVLTYTAPHAVRDALRWRHATLGLARDRAKLLGFEGATFPWRTIDGRECSGYWPAGTAAFHIGADIADAVGRYQAATDDPAFERETGLELLVETARLWRSLGHHDAGGRFRIDGVTGPDEYSAVADNNVYTNLMAQRNLRLAADAVERHADRAAALGVDPEEAAAWRDAAQAMLIPFDEQLGVHPQAEGFTEHQPWDFEHTARAAVPPAAALSLRRPLSQAGDQAGRPRPRPAPARRRLQRRGQGPGLRLLRGAHRARLLAVGLHPGGHRGRGRAPGPGLRLLRRSRPDRSREPRAQHPRRAAHRLAGGRLDRRRRRLRRHARPRRRPVLRASPATATDPPGLRHLLSRPASACRGHPRPGQLLAPAGIASADHPPRPDHHRHHGPTGDPPDHRDRRRQAAKATDGTPPDSATNTRVATRESGVRLSEPS